jgi:hypothetical protein
LNSIERPYRLKSPISQAQFKKHKFNTLNYNKKPKYIKSQIEYNQMPKDGKKIKFKTPNYNKKPKYR